MFTPQWEGVVEGWAAKYIRKNKWRFDPLLEVSDLMQDAYLLFLKLVRYYPSVTTPRHFMALYKTALSRQTIDHVRHLHNYKAVFVGEVHDFDMSPLGQNRGIYAAKRAAHRVPNLIEYNNWGYVAAAIAGAPKELRLALNVYMDRDTVVKPATANRMRKQLMELLA